LPGLLEGDPEFSDAIDAAERFFDFETPFREEGAHSVHQLARTGELPHWAPSVFEGGDFWGEPVVDDYFHPVLASKMTAKLRAVFYAILGRHSPVFEHRAVGPAEVAPAVGFPLLERLHCTRKEESMGIFLNVMHANFPGFGTPQNDLVTELPEPLFTVALALRFIVSVCFTGVQIPARLLDLPVPPALRAAARLLRAAGSRGDGAGSGEWSDAVVRAEGRENAFAAD
jgi:hypothetical protein